MNKMMIVVDNEFEVVKFDEEFLNDFVEEDENVFVYEDICVVVGLNKKECLKKLKEFDVDCDVEVKEYVEVEGLMNKLF